MSRSSSHSWPSVPSGIVAVPPTGSEATLVLRQKRSALKAAGIVIASSRYALTVKIVPVNPFSGRPPSAGGLKRGSRHVPVHSLLGSIFAFACVSLYETRVVYGVELPSMLGSHRVFQKTSLPLKNARLTPALRAASTFARCDPDQYSSCPTERNALCSSSSAPLRAVSIPDE